MERCLILPEVIVDEDVEAIVSEEVHDPATASISGAARQVVVADV